MLTVEMRPAADVGKCAVRACGASQVLVVTAGDTELLICEQCYQDLIEGAAKVGVHVEDDGHLESEIDRLEEKSQDQEAEIKSMERDVRFMEDQLVALRRENEKLNRQTKA